MPCHKRRIFFLYLTTGTGFSEFLSAPTSYPLLSHFFSGNRGWGCIQLSCEGNVISRVSVLDIWIEPSLVYTLCFSLWGVGHAHYIQHGRQKFGVNCRREKRMIIPRVTHNTRLVFALDGFPFQSNVSCMFVWSFFGEWITRQRVCCMQMIVYRIDLRQVCCKNPGACVACLLSYQSTKEGTTSKIF